MIVKPDPAQRDYDGWLGLCPVYLWIANEGIAMTERKYVPEWWLALNIRAVTFIGKFFERALMPWGFTYVGGRYADHSQ